MGTLKRKYILRLTDFAKNVDVVECGCMYLLMLIFMYTTGIWSLKIKISFTSWSGWAGSRTFFNFIKSELKGRWPFFVLFQFYFMEIS